MAPVPKRKGVYSTPPETPKRQRTQEFLATSSGALLGFIAGDIPGAVIGGRLARRLFNSRTMPADIGLNNKFSGSVMPSTSDSILSVGDTIDMGGKAQLQPGQSWYVEQQQAVDFITSFAGKQNTIGLLGQLKRDQLQSYFTRMLALQSEPNVNLQDITIMVGKVKYQSLITNFCNTPIMVRLDYYVAKRNIDQGDDYDNVVGCWEEDEFAAYDGALPIAGLNGNELRQIYGATPQGKFISTYWKKLKSFSFSMPPYATRKINFQVNMNKYLSLAKFDGASGNNGRISGFSIEAMLTICGVPGLAGTVAPLPLTILPAKCAMVTSQTVQYQANNNSKRYTIRAQLPSTAERTGTVGNVDRAVDNPYTEL